MAHTSIDEFIDKLNTIPIEANKMLHQIRKIDIDVLYLHVMIQSEREQTLRKAAQYSNKKSSKLKNQIEQLVAEINIKYKKLVVLSEQKIKLAHKLYNCIDEPTEELDRDISNQARQKNPQQENKIKNKRCKKDQQWQYDSSEPCYCYCRRPSFGQMVMCENTYCETQWFHVDCIEEKTSLADKWFCRDCRQLLNGKLKHKKTENLHR